MAILGSYRDWDFMMSNRYPAHIAGISIDHLFPTIKLLLLTPFKPSNLVFQPPSIRRIQLQQPLLLEVLDNLPNRILHARLIALDLDLRVLRRLVRCTDASELGDLSLAGLLVQALGVARLSDLEREVDEDLDEGQRLVVGMGGLRGVQLAGLLAVCLVWRDEGRDGDGGAVGEQLGDLDAAWGVSSALWLLFASLPRARRAWRACCSECAMRARNGMLRTSAIRLMFSFRLFSSKPRSLLRPKRTLSPSRRYAARPRCSRCCSSAVAMVDLPEAERPVNQMVKPRCLRNVLRSLRERDGCQVMLLSSVSARLGEHGGVWRGSRCHCVCEIGGLGKELVDKIDGMECDEGEDSKETTQI